MQSQRLGIVFTGNRCSSGSRCLSSALLTLTRSSSLTPELTAGTAAPHNHDEGFIYLSSSGRWSQCKMVRILLSRGITLQERTSALEITLSSPTMILVIK